jgi:hypothetical protein
MYAQVQWGFVLATLAAGDALMLFPSADQVIWLENIIEDALRH